MGSPPPPDAPPPEEQSAVSAGLSFEPTPGGASLCGFSLPGFNFNLSIRIPGLPEFPPKFNFALGLNCNLSKPFSASVGFGGGRSGRADPSPDDEYG